MMKSLQSFKSIVFAVAILLLTGCSSGQKITDSRSPEQEIISATEQENVFVTEQEVSSEEADKDAQIFFEEFLRGERYAYSRNNCDYKICLDDIVIPTGEPDKRYFTEYAYLDFDGDGQQELHVRSSRSYYVLICENGELYIWYSRDAVLTPLQNRQFLSIHYGGAPTHEDYICYTLDINGREEQSISFSRYDDNSNGIYDEDETYLFEGEEVNMSEWSLRTAALINQDGSIAQEAVIDILWNEISEM